MKQSNFEKILNSLEASAKKIIDNCNEVIQDDKLARSQSLMYDIRNALDNATNTLQVVSNIRGYSLNVPEERVLFGLDANVIFDEEDK